MIAVDRWTGAHAQALRYALRMSVRAYAAYLGVAVRTVSKWERLGPRTYPRGVSPGGARCRVGPL
ncbi:DNA-binding transcriptional regulator YiaG [Catenuloplanes atrovinosus]|uniref:DNA-binding transcriptional regulator YiaG n=1 Tax=Catenuloplanes atrovinosus TaxID=137266 RepID=A0AAE3YSU9_9ACTN|nr:DNA-binding transcriptional regulator YiaG [Catenuloplanes atrovinosus]